MGLEFLKQSEIFVLIAAIFLLGIVDVENSPQEAETPRHEMSAPRQESAPIVILSEQEERYRFELGSAEVSPFFKGALQARIIPLLDALSVRFDCDAVEVVGHTDGVPVRALFSDLDARLIDAFRMSRGDHLNPGSNVDLGMMRALAIVAILSESQRAGWLERIQFFFPYSAGQMILLDRTLASGSIGQADRARRRIEIRLLKSTETWNIDRPMIDLLLDALE